MKSTSRSRHALLLLLLAALLLVRPHAQEAAWLRSEADPGRMQAVAEALERGLPYVPGEVLVRFNPEMDVFQQTATLSVLRSAPGRSGAHWIGDTLLLQGVIPADAEVAASILREQPNIAMAQPNYLRRVRAVTPNDEWFYQQWNMNEIDMPLAWEISSGAGQGVTVAVLDGGLSTYNGTVNMRLPVPPSFRTFQVFSVPFRQTPDFEFARVLPVREFTPTGPWAIGTQQVLFDTTGHGTHVAGTIAQQTNNAIGFAGVAHGVSLMPIKVCIGPMDWVMAWGDTLRPPPTLDEICDDVGAIAGVRYAADNGAKVINLSIGGESPNPALLSVLTYAVSKASS